MVGAARETTKRGRLLHEPEWLRALAGLTEGQLASMAEAGHPVSSRRKQDHVAQVYVAARELERQVGEMWGQVYVPSPGDRYRGVLPSVPQVVAFMELFASALRIPSQRDFVLHYSEVNAREIAAGWRSGAERHGLACRAAVTWLSLVAETHFAALCVEAGHWAACGRDARWDTQHGLDVLLRDQRGNWSGVCLDLETPQAETHRPRKRRRLPDDLTVFEVPLAPNDGRHEHGPLSLYVREDVELLWGAWVEHFALQPGRRTDSRPA